MASSSSLSSFTRTTARAPPAFEPSHAPPPSRRCRCSFAFGTDFRSRRRWFLLSSRVFVVLISLSLVVVSSRSTTKSKASKKFDHHDPREKERKEKEKTTNVGGCLFLCRFFPKTMTDRRRCDFARLWKCFCFEARFIVCISRAMHMLID